MAIESKKLPVIPIEPAIGVNEPLTCLLCGNPVHGHGGYLPEDKGGPAFVCAACMAGLADEAAAD